MRPLHVVVLAQGQQTRLASLGYPKHLIAVPGTGDTILGRILRQLAAHLPADSRITVVGPDALQRHVFCGSTPSTVESDGWSDFGQVDHPVRLLTLREPGNSAVVGLQQALGAPWRGDRVPLFADPRTTLVLLGDTIYSTVVLTACIRRPAAVLWAGSPDLTSSSGELYAIRVEPDNFDVLLAAVPQPEALRGSYQCGQLRRLLWAYQERGHTPGTVPKYVRDGTQYVLVSDWTKDIDTPADMARLEEIARHARGEGAPGMYTGIFAQG